MNHYFMQVHHYPQTILHVLPRLREFLHRMGRETNQGEIAVDFDGRFHTIQTFDTTEAKEQS